MFVGYRQILAYYRRQTSFSTAGPLYLFLLAFNPVHIGSRPSHILYDPLKSRVLREACRFPEDGGLAALDDGAPLMHGNGAEITLTVASPVRGDAEADSVKKGSNL